MFCNRPFLVPCVALALAGVIGGVAILWPRSAITRRNYERIHIGMPLAEVDHVLGGPSRDESSGPLWSDESAGESVDWALLTFRVKYSMGGPPPPHQEWLTDQLIVLVELDEDDRVAFCNAIEVHRVNGGFLDILRRWLRL
jgi:hypothetical protein